MFNVAGVLLILQRTGSAPLAGATAAAAVVPSALAGPVLGAWLDVARRRRVLIVIDQLLSVLGLAAIVALTGHAADWTVPAVTVLYSITKPLSSGSFFTALAEIAGPELLDHASAVEATSLNLAVIVGPALAGVLVGIIGAAPTVECQAAITVVVAGLPMAPMSPALGLPAATPTTSGMAMASELRRAIQMLILDLSKCVMLRQKSGMAAALVPGDAFYRGHQTQGIFAVDLADFGGGIAFFQQRAREIGPLIDAVEIGGGAADAIEVATEADESMPPTCTA